MYGQSQNDAADDAFYSMKKQHVQQDEQPSTSFMGASLSHPNYVPTDQRGALQSDVSDDSDCLCRNGKCRCCQCCPKWCCGARYCDWCCCGYISIVVLIVAVIVGLTLYFMAIIKPDYEEVFIKANHMSTHTKHESLYFNLSATVIVRAFSNFRVGVYNYDVNYEATFYDWTDLLVHVGTAKCCNGTGQNGGNILYTPPQSRSNITFDVEAPNFPESVYVRMIEEDLPSADHVIPFGLKGYSWQHIKPFGIRMQSYTDCWFALNGSVFVQNWPPTDADTDSDTDNVGGLLDRYYKASVINSTCHYDIRNIKFFQF